MIYTNSLIKVIPRQFFFKEREIEREKGKFSDFRNFGVPVFRCVVISDFS